MNPNIPKPKPSNIVGRDVRAKALPKQQGFSFAQNGRKTEQTKNKTTKREREVEDAKVINDQLQRRRI